MRKTTLGANVLFKMGVADFFFAAPSKSRVGGNGAVPPAWASKNEKKMWEKGKRFARRQLQ